MSTSHVLAVAGTVLFREKLAMLAGTRSSVALVRGSAAARPSGFARPMVASADIANDVEVVVTRIDA